VRQVRPRYSAEPPHELQGVSSQAGQHAPTRGFIEAIRNPLRGFYASLIEMKVFPGPNPAADLKYFIGKGAHRKARRWIAGYFAQEEGP
jgi:hypothetical protein